MTPSDLVETLERHSQWLLNRQGGTPADLALQNLYGYDLTDVNLHRAKLTGADFSQAILSRADLSGSGLFDASFLNAKLQDASLKGANLRGARLRGCDLSGADLSGADLRDGGHLRADRKHGLALTNPLAARARNRVGGPFERRSVGRAFVEFGDHSDRFVERDHVRHQFVERRSQKLRLKRREFKRREIGRRKSARHRSH